MIPDTRLIAQRFNQRASSYHGLSPIQRQMAADLVQLLPTNLGPNNILEIGCGTGHLTRLLTARYPEANVIATDIAENMLTVAANLTPDNAKIVWTQADADMLAEHPHAPLPNLITGNAILQWLPDPILSVTKFAKQLPPGGMAAFALFGPNTFCELQSLLAEQGVVHPLSLLPKASDWRRQLAELNAVVHSDEVCVFAKSASDFLRDTSRSGAALPTASLSHGALRKLIHDYDAHAIPNGVPVTWERIFIIISGS